MEQTFYSIHDCYISHHGIKGQKWGVRRWRNEDGTLTEAGKRKYEKLLKKYTTTDSRGNVHLDTAKLNKRSAARGTAIATASAFAGNRAVRFRKATAALNSSRITDANHDNLLSKQRNADLSSKGAYALATAVFATSVVSATKEARELKFLAKYASNYGNTKLSSLASEISERNDRRYARAAGAAASSTIAYKIFNK